MGTLSIWHILIFGAIALLLFGGRGKLSDLMGDAAKGITSFRKGLRDSDEEPPPRVNPVQPAVALDKKPETVGQ